MQILNSLKPFIASVVLFLLCSCTSSELQPDPTAAKLPLVIDLFAARGFLGGSNFERYYLTDHNLSRECGNLKEDPNPTPSTFVPGVFSSHPFLYPRDGGQIALTKEEQLAISSQALKLFEMLNSDVPEKPETPFSMSEGGIFEVTIKLGAQHRSFSTTLDSIRNEDTSAAAEAQKLLARLRGCGPVMCGWVTFFGIGRAN